MAANDGDEVANSTGDFTHQDIQRSIFLGKFLESLGKLLLFFCEESIFNSRQCNGLSESFMPLNKSSSRSSIFIALSPRTLVALNYGRRKVRPVVIESMVAEGMDSDAPMVPPEAVVSEL